MRLLYLHGFRSSPQSAKAQIMAARVAKAQANGVEIEWHCPQLPPSPSEAFEMIWQWASLPLLGNPKAVQPPLAIMGSSLGGFYAAALTERLLRVGVYARCVLLNPAVHPARDLAAFIGRVKNWHASDDKWGGFEFTQQHVQELRAIETEDFSRPERYMAVIAKGDELLDWREMVSRYPAKSMLLLARGDHALTGFEKFADRALKFCRDK
ncbi:MAG: esterase [Brachymonas sp.]|nr:esterase [Brachymonas sp.]